MFVCACVRVCVQSVSEEEEVPVEELSSEEEEELPLNRLAPPPEAPPPAAFSKGGGRERERLTNGLDRGRASCLCRGRSYAAASSASSADRT